jgi:hypothetical protein
MSWIRVTTFRSPALVLRIAALPLLALAGLSCSINVHNERDEKRRGYRTIQVPASEAGEAALPPELRAEKDEKLHRQTCTIGPGGEVKVYRSLEKEVAHLGASLAPLDPGRARRVGADPFGGVLIVAVDSEGPGARAGLKEDDILTYFAGKPAVTPEQVEYFIEQAVPWTPIQVKVLRGSETISLEVELGSENRIVSSCLLERNLEVADDMRRTGLKLAELPDDIRPLILGPDVKENGLLVVDVLPGGPGFHQGLRFRDLVVKVGDRPVPRAADYSSAIDALPPGEKAAFTVVRDGRTVVAQVPTEDDATRKSAFNILGLVKNETSPQKSEFSLLWGLLFDAESSSTIKEKDDRPEYRTERHWGAVLDLISYRSTAKKKEFRLLWLFPVYWTTG